MFEWEPLQSYPAAAGGGCYEVSHPVLDAQHRHIADLISKLHTSARGEAPGAIEAVLRDFIRFTQSHFETEEEILLQVGYTGVELHKAEHRTLMNQLTKAVELAAEGGHTVDPVWFAATIWSWLHEHTVFSDHKFAPMLRNLTRLDAGAPVIE